MPSRIIKQCEIQSIDDLVNLDIIDWHRLNGTSSSPLVAMRDVSSWFIGRAGYTIIECDLHQFPTRDDWPGWEHSGNHEGIGRLYWNYFYAQHPDSQLTFSDEPDFYGFLKTSNAHFWGDIGKVSVSAFALTTIRKMKAHDIWISIPDYKTQVIIETFENFQELFSQQMGIK